MGFNGAWIRLVMGSMTAISFSVVINGKPGNYFVPTRGLRQGDPLSPYLFLLVSEVLSQNIVCATNHGLLQGVKISRSGPIISHLLFADDSLFFIRANELNCKILMNILENYCHASGQRINYTKSSIFLSQNCPSKVTSLVCSLFKIAHSENLGRYLGIPSVWGRSKDDALIYV
ncbi:hypothetical protein ACFX13_003290 [Malus domestica]